MTLVDVHYDCGHTMRAQDYDVPEVTDLCVACWIARKQARAAQVVTQETPAETRVALDTIFATDSSDNDRLPHTPTVEDRADTERLHAEAAQRTADLMAWIETEDYENSYRTGER